MEYNYPIRHDWSTEEMIVVVAFYEAVEKAYEKSVFLIHRLQSLESVDSQSDLLLQASVLSWKFNSLVSFTK